MGGTRKPVLKNATMDQIKVFRNIDQIFKSVHKKIKIKVNKPYVTRSIRGWNSRKRANLYRRILIETENQTMITEITIKTMGDDNEKKSKWKKIKTKIIEMGPA